MATNPLSTFLQGYQTGNQLRQQDQLFDMRAKQDARQNAQADQEAQWAKYEQFGKQARMVDRALKSGNVQLANSLYQQALPLAQEVAPGEYPATLSANDIQMVSSIADAFDPQPSEQEQFTLAPGSARYGADGRVIASQPFAPEKPQFQTDAAGNGWWIAPGQAPRPVDGGSAPQGGFGIAETDNYVRSILGNVGQIDPNASPEQQAAQILPHLIQQESGGNPNAISPKGAQGLTQVMPATARDPGFGVTPMQGNSPQENVRFGRDYLIAMLKRYPGRPDLALAAYNAGPGVADRFANPTAQAGGLKFPTKGNASTEDKAANWQIVQGQDGTFYRVNKLTGETASAGVQGANALRMQDQHQKRADAVAGIEGAIRSTDETIRSLNLLLEHPGRGAGTGMSSMLPSIPGSDRKNFDAQLATFKAQTFIPMVSQLKGMGALSDAEGKKLMDAVGAIDPQMSEGEFAASLNRIKAQLLRAQTAAYRKIEQLNTNQAPAGAQPAPTNGRPQLPPGFSWED